MGSINFVKTFSVIAEGQKTIQGGQGGEEEKEEGGPVFMNVTDMKKDYSLQPYHWSTYHTLNLTATWDLQDEPRTQTEPFEKYQDQGLANSRHYGTSNKGAHKLQISEEKSLDASW